jgi:hypothetical protein
VVVINAEGSRRGFHTYCSDARLIFCVLPDHISGNTVPLVGNLRNIVGGPRAEGIPGGFRTCCVSGLHGHIVALFGLVRPRLLHIPNSCRALWQFYFYLVKIVQDSKCSSRKVQ